MTRTGVLCTWMATLAIAAMPAWGVAENEAPEAQAEMVAEAPAEAAIEMKQTAAGGEVARAQFTSSVVDREPQDAIEMLSNDSTEVTYFTELRDMQGQTVIHRWEYDGQSWDVAFDVGGPRWRVYSTKSLDPSWTGAWTVKVVDMEGNVLSEKKIEYTSAIVSNEAMPAAPPAAMAE